MMQGYICVILTLLFTTILSQTTLLPWESTILPDDDTDEEQRKEDFECFANCFDIKPAKPASGTVTYNVTVLTHCDKKASWMKPQKFDQTRIYFSRRYLDWMSAFVYCRRYSMDLLTLPSNTLDELFSMKLRKLYKDVGFWLGATDLPTQNKLTWIDSGSEIITTNSYRYNNISGLSGRCIEARAYGDVVHWTRSDCNINKRFVCKMQPACLNVITNKS